MVFGERTRRFDRFLSGLTCLMMVAAASLSAQTTRADGASRSYLGVLLKNIDADRAAAIKLGDPRGVEIERVLPDSPASQAGLQVGDVLLTYNGEQILSTVQLGRLVQETPPGRKVKIQYWREGKTRAAVAAPAEAGPGDDQAGSSTADVAGGWTVANVPRVLMVWDNLALGIECEPIDLQLAQFFGVPSGVLIRQVGKGMLGDKAGLKAGDVITGINERSVAVPADLISYLRTQNAAPGKTLSVEIVREHKKRSVSIALRE